MQLGSASLNRIGHNNQTHAPITNKINVSNFNSATSLKVLNQSSQISQNNNQIPLTTIASEPKQSSLKKQQVLKNLPHASSFLD